MNNLLSRDDEGDDDGENCDSYMSGGSWPALGSPSVSTRMTLNAASFLSADDLMSLLDAGINSDHPSVIIDSEAMFGEDMFGYSTMRTRNSSRTRITGWSFEGLSDCCCFRLHNVP